MFFISHRGNVNGINTKYENHPNFIMSALKMGYHVEVDVRIKNNKFFLGHDEPIYNVNSKFLTNRKIWCHAKSSDALFALKKIKAHYFWHQNDDYTLTSKGFAWTYPGKKLFNNSICVLPEWFKEINIDYQFKGICSDYIQKYYNEYHKIYRI